MRNYERIAADRNRELAVMEAKLQSDNRELSQLRERVNELSGRRGEARSLQTQLNDARQRHQVLCGSIARKHSLPTHANSWEPQRVKEYRAALLEHQRDLNSDRNPLTQI